MADDSNLPEQTLKTTEEVAKTAQALLSFLEDTLGTVPGDLVGVLGGDWLHHYRLRNLNKLSEETRKILEDRGVQPKDYDEVSPRLMRPLLQAASDESDTNLRGLWARLLANAVDPNTGISLRAEFMKTAIKLEPIDVIVVDHISEMRRTQKKDALSKNDLFVALQNSGRISRQSEFEVSLDHIGATGILNTSAGDPVITHFGHEFMRACDPDPTEE